MPFSIVARGLLHKTRFDSALAGWLTAVATLFFSSASVLADEPAEAFLQRLRAEQYFDVALDYLDNLDSYPGVSPELRDAAALERAQIYLEAAGASRLADERDGFFEAGEQALRDFISTKSEHPRVSEARMMLGTRQLIHAMVLSQSPKQDDATREKTRNEYLEAAKTFDQIIETLKVELGKMPTGPIDATENPGLEERREQYRSGYMQAQLQAAQSRRLAAETFEKPAEQGKSLLEEALKRLTDFSEKYSSFPPGVRGMLYRGQVQQMLGQDKAALDSYQRVQESVDDDRLREMKFEAATGTVELRLAEQPPQFKPAIERGQPWVDSARPNEKRSAAIQSLRLALAKAYLVQSENAELPKEKKDAISSARQLLNDAKRVPGPHGDETKELLAKLGVESDADATPQLKRPESLDEAITAAKTLIEMADQLALTEQLLQGKMNEAGADKASLQAEIEALTADMQTQRDNAATMLQQGLALVRPGEDITNVNQARNFLTYVLFRLGRYREAAAVGEFMAQVSPGDPMGLSGGVTALNAMQVLAREAPEEQQAEVLVGLSEIGSLLVKHWPDDPAVAGARGALIAVALNQENWDEARKHLDATPDDSPDKAYFLRVMGNLMWNRYLLRLQENRDDPDAAALLPIAEKDLVAGLKPLKPADVTQRELDAGLILAKVLIRLERDDEALAVLDNPNYGPVKLAGKGDQDFQFKAYTTALQVIIGQMTSMNADTAALTKQAESLVNKMQGIAGKDEVAKGKMVDNFKSLARDIREQMEVAPPAKKETLMTAFETLMTGLANANNDPSTQLMVGQSFAQIGEGAMSNSDRPATGKAAELLASAAEMLRKALPAQSGEEKLKLHYQLGRVERLRGEYSAALKELEQVVTVKQTMLTAQEEAALTYEQWGYASADAPARAAKAHELAIYGSRPDEKKKNQIWGWNTIGKRTGNNPNFRDAFFNARYHLSLNLFLRGKALNDKKKMQDGITQTKALAVFYPDFGGDEWRPKFDRLVRDIQAQLGESVVGLDAFETPPTPTP